MSEGLVCDPYVIHAAFAATDYGKLLASKVRYEKYKPASLSNEQWVKLLGADVNNLTHMPLTYGLAKAFIEDMTRHQPDYFDKEEKELLQVAAIIHDQGEAIVGDISFGDKTKENEAEEKQQFTANLENFCPGVAIRDKRLIVAARDNIVFDPTTKLGRIFNAIERVGYIRTGLRASAHIQNGTAHGCEIGLEWLIADVLSNQTRKLIGYATNYAPVNDYLTHQTEAITTTFSLVSPEIFEQYGIGQQQKEAQFQEAQSAWQTWQSIPR
jgi:hypothetical protein